METLLINNSWEYFLGIIGLLIAVAYYTNGRFTISATDIGRLKETLSDLAINAENVTAKLFKNSAPVSLTATGYHVLHRSGLKSYIDAKRHKLLAALHASSSSDPYDMQRRAFRLLAELTFEEIVGHHLNNFAFSNGISMNILRRVGAIYLRDMAVSPK